MPQDTFKIVVNEDGSFDQASVNRVIYEMVGGAFGRALYLIAEDFLRHAVNYTPIKTGLLRSTGNVRLNDQPVINFHLAVKNPATKGFTRTDPRSLQWKSGKYGVSGSEATLGGSVRGQPVYAIHDSPASIAAKVSSVARSSKSFKFNVGFATPYALWIHEHVPQSGRTGPFGGVRLGKVSLQATRAHKRIYDSWPGKKRKVWVAAKLGRYYGKVGRRYLTRAWDDNEARYFAYLEKWAKGSTGGGRKGFRSS